MWGKFVVLSVVCSIVSVHSLVHLAQASPDPDHQVIVHLKPEAYMPSVVLKNISSFTGDITGVKVHFLDVPMELSLVDMGAKTWESKLTPSQLKSLLGNNKSQKHHAQVKITSKNVKGRLESKTEMIEVLIRDSNIQD